MKKTLLLLTFIIPVLSHAQLIFQDDFSLYTVGQELSGQGLWSNSPTAPNVGIGACVPLIAMQPCSGTKVVAQSLSYLNYGSSNNSIEIASAKDGVAKAISPIVTDGDLYVGLVLNLTTAPTTSSPPVDFIRILNSDQTLVTFRMLVVDDIFGYYIGIRKGSSGNATVYTTDLYNYGESVLVILKYSHLPGNNDDIVTAYVNPDYTAGEPASASVISTSGFDQSGAIDRIAFRQNYNIAASMPTGFAGLVSTSTTWEGLKFQPLSVDQFENNALQFSGELQNGTTQIKSKSNIDNAILNVYDIAGALIESKKLNIPAGNSQIQFTTKFSSGVYIFQIVDESGTKHSYKLIAH